MRHKATAPTITREIPVDLIKALLHEWHELGRANFERRYPGLNYDDPIYLKSFDIRRRYICLDVGTQQIRSGAYIIDRTTGDIFSIEAYGRPNRRHYYGNIFSQTPTTIASQLRQVY